MIRSIAICALVGATTLGAAHYAQAEDNASGAEISKRAADTWNAIKAYSVDKRNEAAEYGAKLMKDMDGEIAQLEAKAAKASGAAKSGYDKEIEALKTTRAATAAKLDKMKQASGGAWSEAKQGFADAYRDLQRAYDKAAGKF